MIRPAAVLHLRRRTASSALPQPMEYGRGQPGALVTLYSRPTTPACRLPPAACRPPTARPVPESPDRVCWVKSLLVSACWDVLLAPLMLLMLFCVLLVCVTVLHFLCYFSVLLLCASRLTSGAAAHVACTCMTTVAPESDRTSCPALLVLLCQ